MANGVDVVNIDVIYLVYNSKRNPTKPFIEFDSNCLVGLSDLHYHGEEKRYEKHTMDRQSYKHYKWYNAILQQELYAAPYGFKLQLFHWFIESGEIKAFRLADHTFDVISMIIGPTIEHWFGANTNPMNVFCMHGHNQRSTAPNLSGITTIATYNLAIDINQTMMSSSSNSNSCNDNDGFEHKSEEICNCDESKDNLDDECNDILLLKITLKQFVCPKRTKKHNLKFMNSMITINEE